MKKFLLLGGATVAVLSGQVTAAHADTNMNDPMSWERTIELRHYMEYEEREPCQNYRPVPEGFYRDGCDLMKIVPKQEVVVEQAQPAPVVAPAPKKVLRSYAVYFGFDKSNITADSNATLSRVADEIKTYNPSEVVVAGYADKAGTSSYNLELSQKRANAVSEALTQNGVQNRVIDEEAYGEMHPAVETPDGVPEAENRRVVIEFLK